ncbi:hypothetical protein LEMLEM_LOCUS312 [Lemmus lemmus]
MSNSLDPETGPASRVAFWLPISRRGKKSGRKHASIPINILISIPINIPTSIPSSIPISIPITIPSSIPISIPSSIPISIYKATRFHFSLFNHPFAGFSH